MTGGTMAKKTMYYRCYWKEDKTGYTYEEALVIKSKVDCQNGLLRNRSKCGEAEIVEDPRGGYMVSCTEL